MQFGLVEGNGIKCLKQDTIIKNELLKERLEADQKLSRLQNFVLDAAGPFIAVYEDLT